jgi:hypothetical protein
MEMEDAWVRSRSLGLQQQRRAHGQAPGTVESSKVQFGDMIYEAEARARLGGTHTRARTHLRSTLAGFYFLMPRAAAGPRCFCLSYPKSRPPRAGTNHVVGLVAFSGGCPWPPLASPRPRSAAPLPSFTPRRRPRHEKGDSFIAEPSSRSRSLVHRFRPRSRCEPIYRGPGLPLGARS